METHILAISLQNERIAPVFDVARKWERWEISQGVLEQVQSKLFPGSEFAAWVEQIQREGVHSLVCGAITGWMQQALEQAGIRVYPFVCGERTAVLALAEKKALDTCVETMPGCCKRRQQSKGGTMPNRNGTGPRGNGGGSGRGLGNCGAVVDVIKKGLEALGADQNTRGVVGAGRGLGRGQGSGLGRGQGRGRRGSV